MKIAVFHELSKGGAVDSVNRIALGLKKKHRVDLYSIEKSPEDKKFYSHVYVFPFKYLKWNGGDWISRLYKDSVELLKLYFLEKHIAQIIDTKKYNLVFVNASRFLESPFILRFGRTRKIFYLHDPYYRLIYEPKLHPIPKGFIGKEYYERLNRFVRKILDRGNARSAHQIISNSDFSKQLFNKTYQRKAVVIPLGIDVSFFLNRKKVPRDIDILYIGSKSTIDGYDTFQRIKSNFTKNIKVREVLYENEWLSQLQIKDLYHRSKIVLCLARNEPLGLVPLEAMASGAIPIAVDEGGYRETIITNQTGYLIARNEELFGKKITALLKNEAKQREFRNNGKINVTRKWSIQKTIQMLDKFFENAIQ